MVECKTQSKVDERLILQVLRELKSNSEQQKALVVVALGNIGNAIALQYSNGVSASVKITDKYLPDKYWQFPIFNFQETSFSNNDSVMCSN